MTTALTVGVVGHVDHGKTALVRALTGIETDRLEEERERGLSIVLGFSYLETPSGTVDLIDVPGHEDFIRAMISGATGLDGVVLCVAANEGVMPQTREHFDIARLLGVERGFVIVTKTDLVDATRLAAVEEEIRTFVAGTFLENAPILEASAATGAGLEAVGRSLGELAAAPSNRETGERFFLPLDRVFTMRGFGLVGTGTLRGGAIEVDDRVEVMPARRAATVRALQNHGRPVERAEPGQRIAVNLRNVDREQVSRGDTVASPGFLTPTKRIDAELTLLEDSETTLANGANVRVLIGTSETVAKLRLLDRRELEPGATGLVQLRCNREIATHRTERCLIRSYSPMRTIGGARILDVNPSRHRRFDAAVTERLQTAASGDAQRILEQRLEQAGVAGVDPAALCEELALPPAELGPLLAAADAIEIGETCLVSRACYGALLRDVVAALEAFHRDHPLKNGIPASSLGNLLSPAPAAAVSRHAIEALVAEKRIDSRQEILSIAGFDPFAALSDAERRALAQVEEEFRQSRLEPPSVQAVVGRDAARQVVYRLLIETGRLVRLKTYDRDSQLVLHAETLEDVRRAIASEFPYPKQFALKHIRDLLGSTRKYVVPLMEHLDATGTTVRKGDLRHLRR